VEELITPRTSGIIGVHVWGNPCEVNGLGEIAARRNLKLMFDAAHAFGCSHNGQMIGNFGEAEVFSFHATKFFNTFEGGAVVTNDDQLAAKIRLMSNFGFSGYDNVIYIGTNGKMSEVSAAMGLAGLDSLDEFIATNKRNYDIYRRELDAVPGVTLMAYDSTEKSNYQYVVVEVDEAEAGISRDAIMETLWAENVLARRYFYPGCHRMEPYRSYFPHAGLLLPETEELVKRVLILPTGTAAESDAIFTICEVMKVAAANGPTVEARLAQSKRLGLDHSSC
jgi:dTDP-4-amino-4,6-dideoxygalactose transaminase